MLLVLAVAGCGPNASPRPAASTLAGPPTAPGSSSVAAVGSPPACPAAATAPSPLATSVPGWWRDRVFYEVFVRSFADGNGDGIGDLRGLIGRLDQLNDGDPGTTTDLGVTGLWLMPTFPSPSYHGYDVTDYRSVNPDYGTLADM
ncbi:MAG: alpha-amylase, partial [Chloroflexota bacterium]|nr:alpha-amylase [Chloroflexota bacterium]